MTQISRKILKGVLILSYIAIIALITFGISSIFNYLNTGADRSSMLHTEIKKVDQYLPKIDWAPLKNEGRLMDTQTLETTEKDYLDAWYIKHLAYKTNKTIGVDDYYTKSARKNIYNFISQNKNDSIHIEETTLEHHLSLNFFSEDGQFAVLTDKNVIEYKRIYQYNEVVTETTEKSTYKVVLLLEDGFWRIRHIIKEKTEPYKNEFIPSKTISTSIKGINYYPQASPWNMYGDIFDTDTISKDFELIQTAGLNTIRIFVPYASFGKANIQKEKLKKLKQVLDIADQKELKVIVTLFDFYGDYDVLNWTLNQQHATTIINSLKTHNALLAWDIKNEPDLDFKSRGKTTVISWLEHMVAHIKSVDKEHPITIGWSNAKSCDILYKKVDVVTFHYYDDLNDLEKTYQGLKESIPNKPIFITEYGMSSYSGFWNFYSRSEKDQANYHQQAQKIFSKNDISFVSWTLYDFPKIPKEVVGRLPWRRQVQKHFGFLNQNGGKKPAFQYISKE